MKGHPILGLLSGLVFGTSLSVLLLSTGVLPTDSILVVVLPLLGLSFGLALGLAAPFGRKKMLPPAAGGSTPPPAPEPAPVPAAPDPTLPPAEADPEPGS